MDVGPGGLLPLLTAELDRDAQAEARALAKAIRERHGDTVAAVVFYGSCLRKRSAEGVLDFYVLVDSYRAAYASRRLRWLNQALPPNVFYLEVAAASGTLRSKYAVISLRDFAAATRISSLRTGIWARFCQPALAVYHRDAAARKALASFAAAAVETALRTGLALLPGPGDMVQTRLDALWQRILAETYAVELRPESPETVGSVYLADPERFDATARAGLAALAATGPLRWRETADGVEVTLPAGERERLRRAWARRRLPRKALYLVALLKSALTFGDWLPYVLWKLERHTGEPIELTERQRRHPLVFGWPVLVRVLRRRILK